MSDIAIRFDGLLLAAVLALTALLCAAFIVVALITAACSDRYRSHCIALTKVALAQAGFSLACLFAVIVYINVRSGPMPTFDWIDWLVVPWLVLLCLGILRLFRTRDAA